MPTLVARLRLRTFLFGIGWSGSVPNCMEQFSGKPRVSRPKTRQSFAVYSNRVEPLALVVIYRKRESGRWHKARRGRYAGADRPRPIIKPERFSVRSSILNPVAPIICRLVSVAAQSRAMLPVFGGISGSTRGNVEHSIQRKMEN